MTNGRHTLVPKDVREEAEKYAKVRQADAARQTDNWLGTDRQVTSGVFLQDSLEEEDDSDEDNM